MPIADPKTYKQMLDAARDGKFAFPAINISSSESLNAALRGFAEAKSDGIVQVSTGGGEFGSGATVKDGVLGAVALAEYAHIVAEKCPVNIALHTDHCHPEKVDTFLKPLLEVSRKRIAAGKGPLFQSHMFDGSPIPLAENMKIAKQLLAECAELDIILEIEAGVVGGEEDGGYLFAATFGNVHGVYKPGNVVLKPTILRDGQAAVEEKYGEKARFLLVFHGGSGSPLDQIRETLDYGVIKMNVDTDTQYALTRGIADHMFKNYDGVLKVDGEVGVKKVYDPRSWGKAGETSMAARVVEACDDLRSTGTTLRK
jgi:fructose-bisphosphate aldolase class II